MTSDCAEKGRGTSYVMPKARGQNSFGIAGFSSNLASSCIKSPSHTTVGTDTLRAKHYHGHSHMERQRSQKPEQPESSET